MVQLEADSSAIKEQVHLHTEAGAAIHPLERSIAAVTSSAESADPQAEKV